MTEPVPALDLVGPIVINAGLLAGLLFAVLAAYGLVVAMGRWWLVIGAAAVLLALLAHVYAGTLIAPFPADTPLWLSLDAKGLLGIVLAYILLGATLRLYTLRLEWRGLKRRYATDIHILGFLMPTATAIMATAWLG
ncbi:MAG: hypothetical protein AB7E80_04585 [Hyphomicrobiaceae bacterium]